LPGTLAATGSDSGGSKSITISGVTNLSATTSYCVDVTGGPIAANPSAGQYEVTVTTQTSGPADIDTATIAARIISDDQVVVSAVVPPSFNFVLDGNATSFTSNLDT